MDTIWLVAESADVPTIHSKSDLRFHLRYSSTGALPETHRICVYSDPDMTEIEKVADLVSMYSSKEIAEQGLLPIESL